MVYKKTEEKTIIPAKEDTVEDKVEKKEPQPQIQQSPVHGFFRG